MTEEDLNAIGEAYRMNLVNYTDHWFSKINERRLNSTEMKAVLLSALGVVDELSEFMHTQLEVASQVG